MHLPMSNSYPWIITSHIILLMHLPMSNSYPWIITSHRKLLMHLPMSNSYPWIITSHRKLLMHLPMSNSYPWVITSHRKLLMPLPMSNSYPWVVTSHSKLLMHIPMSNYIPQKTIGTITHLHLNLSFRMNSLDCPILICLCVDSCMYIVPDHMWVLMFLRKPAMYLNCGVLGQTYIMMLYKACHYTPISETSGDVVLLVILLPVQVSETSFRWVSARKT